MLQLQLWLWLCSVYAYACLSVCVLSVCVCASAAAFTIYNGTKKLWNSLKHETNSNTPGLIAASSQQTRQALGPLPYAGSPACPLGPTRTIPKNYLALISIEKCARQQKLSVPANLAMGSRQAARSKSLHSWSPIYPRLCCPTVLSWLQL